jgi:hypothetical protein
MWLKKVVDLVRMLEIMILVVGVLRVSNACVMKNRWKGKRI